MNPLRNPLWSHLKFAYSEKATKFCEIFSLLLSYLVPVKSKVKISQNFVAFSEYMNFKYLVCIYSVGEHQFEKFEKDHPEMTGEGYEFNDRSLIILIPSSANFPKVPSRKKNGFEKIQDRFCEIPVNIPGEFSSRVYNHRKPIKLDAHRVYLDLVVKSYMKNILFDFPMCLKSCIGK